MLTQTQTQIDIPHACFLKSHFLSLYKLLDIPLCDMWDAPQQEQYTIAIRKYQHIYFLLFIYTVSSHYAEHARYIAINIAIAYEIWSVEHYKLWYIELIFHVKMLQSFVSRSIGQKGEKERAIRAESEAHCSQQWYLLPNKSCGISWILCFFFFLATRINWNEFSVWFPGTFNQIILGAHCKCQIDELYFLLFAMNCIWL